METRTTARAVRSLRHYIAVFGEAADNELARVHGAEVDKKNKGPSGGSFDEYSIGDVRKDFIRDVLSRGSRIGKLLP